MPARTLPTRPNLEQYKKQAKELLAAVRAGDEAALTRMRAHSTKRSFALTDAQFVIAREHGFDSWTAFAARIAALRLEERVQSIADPVAAFIRAATADRDSHRSGTVDEANVILARYPDVATANIHTAAILADERRVREILVRDPASATAKGGPDGWDALTHLCFSRYLRLDKSRSDAFVATARALLDSGASANTGWFETIDLTTRPRQIIESAIYGAAGVAQHPGLTKLLLERGADPNDEETPYHVPETRDNTVLQILLESGTLSAKSLSCLLLRKTDWHDYDGLELVLKYRPDPNQMTVWGDDALHHAIRRDNGLEPITALLDAGANPTAVNVRDGRTAVAMAAHRGRGDVLLLLEARGVSLDLSGVDRLIAACAMDDEQRIKTLRAAEPDLEAQMAQNGGTLLAEFAGVGNEPGVRNLLDCGVSPGAIYAEGDGYFDTARDSTALHVAAWRGNSGVVKLLIARGAPVDAVDGKGRTAMMLAVKACVDSYWMEDRTPDSVKALLDAGASRAAIEVPCGYDEVDRLLDARAPR